MNNSEALDKTPKKIPQECIKVAPECTWQGLKHAIWKSFNLGLGRNEGQIAEG